jgi:hypothetical protein
MPVAERGFAGRSFKPKDLLLIREIVNDCAGLSRLELADWPGRYGVEPWLVETLVDRRRYWGGCYRAANWIVLGETTGRGRMDRHRRREGEAPKTLLVYPLASDAARRLREA